ncbi:alternative ribosome rescue aminoacyl-tRNA hydrolase ArfB [Xanthomonas phaseoli]|uniref:alternative ribosome rescue aminoacyl-tRNA hydrolase ArfB n=1 Tax=Xanthomonas phaseoli TaxID=1985254 RepID=UPI001EE687B3|nr:alternative ribosome rescue aminoacyl-tRNA hydrolase ArfB [Xanthomonas phaseoli]
MPAARAGRTSTRCPLRWSCVSTWLARPRCPSHCGRVLSRRDRRMTAEGVLVIDAQRFRTQDRNRDDARERLVEIISACLSVPKRRVATKPSHGAKLRRLDAKRERSQIKRGRSASHWE